MADMTTASTFQQPAPRSDVAKQEAAVARQDKIERDAAKRNADKIDDIDHDQVDRTDLNPTDRPEITVGVTGTPQVSDPAALVPPNLTHDAQPDQTPPADTNLNPNPDRHGDPKTAHLAKEREKTAQAEYDRLRQRR